MIPGFPHSVDFWNRLFEHAGMDYRVEAGEIISGTMGEKMAEAVIKIGVGQLLDGRMPDLGQPPDRLCSQAIAFKLYSHVLENEIWVVWDKNFLPPDNTPIYTPEEVAEFQDKTQAELRAIYESKRRGH